MNAQNKVKHTPGPWIVDGVDITTEGSKDFVTVAIVETSKPVEVVHANARIIAAAPELLEALKLAHSLLENMLEQEEYEVSSEVGEAIENIQETIMNALAKAEGRE